MMTVFLVLRLIFTSDAHDCLKHLEITGFVAYLNVEIKKMLVDVFYFFILFKNQHEKKFQRLLSIFFFIKYNSGIVLVIFLHFTTSKKEVNS